MHSCASWFQPSFFFTLSPIPLYFLSLLPNFHFVPLLLHASNVLVPQMASIVINDVAILLLLTMFPKNEWRKCPNSTTNFQTPISDLPNLYLSPLSHALPNACPRGIGHDKLQPILNTFPTSRRVGRTRWIICCLYIHIGYISIYIHIQA